MVDSAGMQSGIMLNNVLGMIAIGFIGLALAILMRIIERRLCSWREKLTENESVVRLDNLKKVLKSMEKTYKSLMELILILKRMNLLFCLARGNAEKRHY